MEGEPGGLAPLRRAAAADARSWTAGYGALILFFETFGHTDVTRAYDNGRLHRWAEEQRSLSSTLSTLQVRQLRIFNFRFTGRPSPPSATPQRCSREACRRFAAFNGLCHHHFSAVSSDEEAGEEQPEAAAAGGGSAEAGSVGALSGAEPAPAMAIATLLAGRTLITLSDGGATAAVEEPVKAGNAGAPAGVVLSSFEKKIAFPLIGLKQRKNGNYDIDRPKDKLKDISRAEVIEKLRSFVQKLSQHNCRAPDGTTPCTCLEFLRCNPLVVESVSHAILDYYCLPHLQRRHYAVERIRCAEMARKTKGRNERVFPLPLSYEYFERMSEESDGDAGDNSNEQETIGQAFKHSLCLHAFNNLHNIGTTQRKTLRKYANGDVSVGQHGNAGKAWAGGGKYAEAYASLRDTLRAVTEEHREHEDDCGDVVLPVGLSRRRVYERWTRDRGWAVTKRDKSTGQYTDSKTWETVPGFYRTKEDAVEHGGDARHVAKLAVSWTLFAGFWNKEFPCLKTQGRVGKGMFGGKYDFETKKYYT